MNSTKRSKQPQSNRTAARLSATFTGAFAPLASLLRRRGSGAPAAPLRAKGSGVPSPAPRRSTALALALAVAAFAAAALAPAPAAAASDCESAARPSASVNSTPPSTPRRARHPQRRLSSRLPQITIATKTTESPAGDNGSRRRTQGHRISSAPGPRRRPDRGAPSARSPTSCRAKTANATTPPHSASPGSLHRSGHHPAGRRLQPRPLARLPRQDRLPARRPRPGHRRRRPQPRPPLQRRCPHRQHLPGGLPLPRRDHPLGHPRHPSPRRTARPMRPATGANTAR